MSVWKRIARSNFYIKLRSWEYWPFGILQFPMFFYYPWLSFRAGSFLFFSASNPGIEMGGMFGESKFSILQKIPSGLVPKTRLVKLPANSSLVSSILTAEGFSLPVIFKPDLGERGFMVKKITSPQDIAAYLEEIKIDFLVQDLVDLPLEFGVFYAKRPSEERGKVVSIVMKEMLFVVGDGKSTLRDLILKNDRAKLQWEKLQNMYSCRLDTVIAAGEKIELVSIGNHALGTKFINANYLITEKLSNSFDAISQRIEGFYFGRFDLRCASFEDLQNGNVKVVELNGCGAEPAHIYDPSFKFFDAMKVLILHWNMIFEISRENHKRGVAYISFRDGLAYYRKFKAVTK